MIMTTNDTFYLAYERYKKELQDNRDVHLFRKGVNSRKSPDDYLSMIVVECEIDEEWIATIEKGLHYISKAIKEDRQFIRNEGEVLPIEKIRRVSKDSIVDLSKHSNYITRVPEDVEDNVVPEKLLMIKRENDYSIYENRVVYTTLSYLKDFIASRLDKIKEATNRYNGVVQIKKKIELGYRTVDVNLNINDIQNNDPLALSRNLAMDKIKRIDMILNSVLVLLRTPLMQEVSKAPMVSRPITKTNVLKMNTNFKESLAVFDYVCAYNGPGFVIKETEKRISPLTEAQENCFTDIILLTSFLSYLFNNSLEKQLHKNYLLEEKRRQEVIDDEYIKKVKELIDKASKSGKDLGDYLFALENSFRALEQRVEDTKNEMKELIEKHQQEISDLEEKHQQEIDKLNEYHDELVAKLQDEHDIALAELEEKRQQEMAQHLIDTREALSKEFGDKIASLEEGNQSKQEEINSLRNELDETKKQFLAKDEQQTAQIKDLTKQLDTMKAFALTKKYDDNREGFDLNDLSTQEAFDELERQKAIIDELFDKAWKNAKRVIKKKHYKIEKVKKGDK